ncbi:carbohydrate ABC transporter permease [Microbacterium sp. No. 7]|uniref:carbohydrate ABC transporter permease n=1 Tax=Microbacterium sp. No. 7 TaxID=1714373 RepID=UPI0006D14E28|nr:sugar ABC transporter permease [Microbacterium sp. No. 7]ALJ21984.1 ABC transporter permease [Microbacterium sp. No. 7]
MSETTAIVTRDAPRRRAKRSSRHVSPLLYLFPIPALVLYTVFFVIPTLQTFQYSVTNWDGYSPEFDYVGIDNFVRAIAGDALFTNALGNNMRFMVVVVIGQTAVALIMAILLVKNTKTTIFLRALYFFPTILSSVSVGFIWKFVYDPNFGVINSSLDALGMPGLKSSFLGDPAQAIYWLAVTQIWFHAGMMIVIFVAGLQAIPAEFYEAAEVDGAGPWRRFTSITWPLIAPAMSIVVAYTTIQSFKAFDVVLSISGNPPSASLDILSTRIYSTFANSQFGYAATQSVLFIIFILVITFVIRRFLRLVQRGE